MSNKPEGDLSLTAKKKALKEEAKLQEQKELRQKAFVEKCKMVVSLVVLALGFVLFYVLPANQFPGYLRAVLPVVSVVFFVLMVLFWCTSGKRLIQYIKDSVVEIKKVVWPTRNEAVRQTLFVLAFVFILAGFTWLCDWSLQGLVYNLIMGVGG